jgi:L-lactate utilization protein LutC
MKSYKQFEQELKKIGGEAQLISKSELPAILKQLNNSGNNSKFSIYESSIMKKNQFELLLRPEFLDTANWILENRPTSQNPEDYRQRILETDVAIIAADYLLADSGTVVLLQSNHQSQLLTLLPSTLVVLSSSKSILPDMPAFFNKLSKKEKENEDSIIFITGPSKTADIEKILILGVHGPEEVKVLVISDDPKVR